MCARPLLICCENAHSHPPFVTRCHAASPRLASRPSPCAVDLVRWGFLFLVVLFGFAQAILFVADTDTLGQYEGRFALGMITRQLIDVFFQPQLADSANDRYFLLPVLIFGFLGSVLLTNLLIATLSGA